MPFQNNYFLHAVAGSGKTTKLVKLALRAKNKKILITTYTNKNTNEIKNKIIEKFGYVPENIEVKTWFGFLLSDCIRPYQRVLGLTTRVSDMYFTVQDPHNKKLPNGTIIKTAKREDGIKYYINKENKIYSCFLSDFACSCNHKTKGALIKRIEKCYDYIFVDEAQDLSGWDFSFLDLLLHSNSKILIVGDMRQNLFDTHKSNKNKKYAENLHLYFIDKQKQKLGKLKEMNISYRCNQIICDFADKLHKDLPSTKSLNLEQNFHSGIFYITENQIEKYIHTFSPKILVWNKKNKICNLYKSLNLGDSKGLTFDRVIISPTAEITNYLKVGNFSKESLVVKNKLYVGITRAKYSVAFIVKDSEDLSKYAFSEITQWKN